MSGNTDCSADYKSGKIIYLLLCILLAFFGVFLIIYHLKDWSFTGNLPSCYINRVWHIYCPACGGTRSFDHLLHARFLSSLLANPLLISALIFFCSYFLPASYTFLIKRNGNIYYHFHKKLLILLIVYNIGYFLLRNFSLIFLHFDFIQENTQYWIK